MNVHELVHIYSVLDCIQDRMQRQGHMSLIVRRVPCELQVACSCGMGDKRLMLNPNT